MQLLLTASPRIAQNKQAQSTISTLEEHNGVAYLKTGTIEQPILAKTGDHICIDWGYFYMPAINGTVSLNTDAAIKDSFLRTGKLPASKKEIVAKNASENPLLGFWQNKTWSKLRFGGL